MIKSRLIRVSTVVPGVMMFIAVTTKIIKIIMVLTMFIRVIMNIARIARFTRMMTRTKINKVIMLFNGNLLELL